MTALPDAITRYLAAADAQDSDAVAAAFNEDGSVRDEGATHAGRAAIRAWREAVGQKYTYTTEVTGSEHTGEGEYRVLTHVVGDFPGGEVDLAFDFVIRGDHIASLTIG